MCGFRYGRIYVFWSVGWMNWAGVYICARVWRWRYGLVCEFGWARVYEYGCYVGVDVWVGMWSWVGWGDGIWA